MSRFFINALLLAAMTWALGYKLMGLGLLVKFLNIKGQCELKLMVTGKFNKTTIDMGSLIKSDGRCHSKFLANRPLSSPVELLSVYLVVAGLVAVVMTCCTFRHVQTNVNWKLLRNYAVITSVTNAVTAILTMVVYNSWKLKNGGLNNDETELFDLLHAIFIFTLAGALVSWLILVPLSLSACTFAGMERAATGRVDDNGAEDGD